MRNASGHAGGHGQGEAEDGSAAGLGIRLRPDLAAVRLDDGARDVQAQPQAAEAASAAVLVGLEEAIEDRIGLVRADADPLIEHRHVDVATRRLAGPPRRHRRAST